MRMSLSGAAASYWTCGHQANGMCSECYRELARKAGELAEEGRLHRERIVLLEEELNIRQQRAHVLAESVISLGEENHELRDQLSAAEKERDIAWAKIDQLLGRAQ